MTRDDLRNIEDVVDGAPEPNDCSACRGYGHFTRNGKPSIDKRDRKCLDCGGTGKAEVPDQDGPEAAEIRRPRHMDADRGDYERDQRKDSSWGEP